MNDDREIIPLVEDDQGEGVKDFLEGYHQTQEQGFKKFLTEMTQKHDRERHGRKP